MDLQQVFIVFISNDLKNAQNLIGLLNAPFNKVLSCSFAEAYDEVLINEKPDIVVVDVISFPDFSYSEIEKTRFLPKYAHIPFLFLISPDEKIILQLYKYQYNRILVEPIDRYLLVNEITNSIHYSRIEQQLKLYKNIVDGEEKLISHIDELMELNQLKKIKSFNDLVNYTKQKIIPKIELMLAAEKAVFLNYNPNGKEGEASLNFYAKEDDLQEIQFFFDESRLAGLFKKNFSEIYEKDNQNNILFSEIEKLFGFPVSGILFVPLILFHKPIGALLLINKLYRNSFSENDLAFATILAQKLIYQFESVELNKKPGRLFKNLVAEGDKQTSDLIEQVLSKIDFGLIIFDSQMHVFFKNKASSDLLNVKPKSDELKALLGDKWFVEVEKCILENNFPVIRQEIKMSAVNEDDFYIGYSVYKMDWDYEKSYYILVFSEISQTKKLQSEIIRMDRMASLGVLSSGIAHEIRNPLAGIKAMAQNMEEELDKNSSHLEYIKRILRQVDRLDLLLRSFFTYAKPMRPDPKPCQIPEIISEALALFPSQFRQNSVKVFQNYADDLAYVYIDPAQIQQVFINLVLNAIQAMKEGGNITISAHNTEQKVPYVDSEKSRRKKQFDKFILLELKDEGEGMDDSIKEKIFNPFFTTKSSGTGLGLAIVYQIINEHGGNIDVDSNPGQGTTFKILLPALVEKKTETGRIEYPYEN